MRLDCVVASLCDFSRKEADAAIADGRVSVNSIAVQKSTYTVESGSIVTVRQKGRFEITDCSKQSKKGRIILEYNKYV